MTKYREERELVIRLHLSAEFDEAYEGDDDGFAWYEAFDREVRPELMRELVRALAASGRYRITPINRGLDAREEVELDVAHQPR